MDRTLLTLVGVGLAYATYSELARSSEQTMPLMAYVFGLVIVVAALFAEGSK